VKNKVFEKVLSNVQNTVRNYSMLETARRAATRIRLRTRLGWGVKDGERGNPRVRLLDFVSTAKFTKISKTGRKTKRRVGSYIDFRRRSKELNRTVTSPSRSNLTFTGKLLDSLIGKEVRGKAVVEVLENRTDGALNSDIIKGQAEQGRHFFELTDKEFKGLRNELKKDLIKEIKKRKR